MWQTRSSRSAEEELAEVLREQLWMLLRAESASGSVNERRQAAERLAYLCTPPAILLRPLTDPAGRVVDDQLSSALNELRNSAALACRAGLAAGIAGALSVSYRRVCASANQRLLLVQALERRDTEGKGADDGRLVDMDARIRSL